MQKPTKTTGELEQILSYGAIERGLTLMNVSVYPCDNLGWDANFTAATHLVIPYTSPFQALVAETRGKFDLAKIELTADDLAAIVRNKTGVTVKMGVDANGHLMALDMPAKAAPSKQAAVKQLLRKLDGIHKLKR